MELVRHRDLPQEEVADAPRGSRRPWSSRWPRSVHLESDAFFRFVRSDYVEPWKPESHQQNRVVMGIVADAAAGYAAVDSTAIAQLWESFADLGELERHVLDVDGKEPEEAADLVASALAGGRLAL